MTATSFASTALVVGVGGALGLAWYHLVGCQTGACPITSHWWSSTAYGALMGYLVKLSWLG